MEQKKNGVVTISKETTISIGTGIAILFFVLQLNSRITTIENTAKFHIEDPNIHYSGFRDVRDRLDKHEEIFVPKTEITLMLEQMDLKIGEIKEMLGKEKARK